MFIVRWVERLYRRLSALRPAHWLFLILGFALALRVIFFSGLCVADDFTYCRFAGTILRGEPYFSAESEFRSLRWPTILPVVLSFRLFGVGEAAAVWGSLVYSLGGIGVLFLLGRRLFGDRVGLYAALLLAVFPGDVLFATQLMPDIAISFFMGISVLFFLKGEAATDHRKAMWFYGLCGVAMLGAFLCRVTAVYHFLLFVCLPTVEQGQGERGKGQGKSLSPLRLRSGQAFAPSTPRPVAPVRSRPASLLRASFRLSPFATRWLIFGAFGVALGLLYGFYYLKTGDLFYEFGLLNKIRATEERLGRITELQFSRNLGYMIPIIMSRVEQLDFYAVEARVRLASPYLFGFFYYFIIPCFFYWALRVRRDARLSVPVLWLLITYLYSEFGTISLSRYQHMVKLPRYLFVQTLPGLLLVALLVDRLIHGDRGRGTGDGRRPARIACGVSILLFLIVTSVGITRREAAGSRGHIAPYRATYALLKDRPRKDLFVTEGWWPLRMSHYFGRENGYVDPPGGPGNRLKLLKNLRDVRDVRDAYVVVDRNPFLGIGDFKFPYATYPSFVERTPPHWQRLGAFYNVEVYYAPQDVPPAVVEAYAKPPPSAVADFSTWQGARSALERAVREQNFELFKSCLSEKLRAAYDDAQLRAMFNLFLRTPNVVAQLERKHFFEEKGKWRPFLEVEQGKGRRPSVVVQ